MVLRLWLALSLFLVTRSALAGWNSGGGEVFEHAVNPWFLEADPRPVSYCIAIGPDFTVPAPRLSEMVQEAIRWWDQDFRNAFVPENLTTAGRPLYLRVKTTGFREETCTDATDIHFQFGELNDVQKQYFAQHQVDVTRFVALTIRTDYDLERLRGKGFVYVSPDRGPQAFKGESIVENAWDEEWRLAKVIHHEIGHIHGIAHQGDFSEMMGASYLEFVVSKLYPTSKYMESFFHPSEGHKVVTCGDTRINLETALKFFGAGSADHCLRVYSYFDRIVIEGSASWNDPWHQIGQANFSEIGQRRIKNVVYLWLPVQQKVFPEAILKVLLGPSSVQLQRTGTYQSQDGKVSRSLFVHVGASSFQIGGEMDGKIVPDVFSAIPNVFGQNGSGWQDIVFKK